MFLGSTFPWRIRALGMVFFVVLLMDLLVWDGEALWLVLALFAAYVIALLVIGRERPTPRR